MLRSPDRLQEVGLAAFFPSSLVLTALFSPPPFSCFPSGFHLSLQPAVRERQEPTSWLREATGAGGDHPPSFSPRTQRAGHGGSGGGEGALGVGRLAAPAYFEPGRATLRHFGPDGGLHRLLLSPLHLHLHPALAGPAVPTQALQLPDRVPVSVPAVVGAAHRAFLLLLQELCHGQHSGTLSLLAALLLPRLPAVLHALPHEPVLCAGELLRCYFSFSCASTVFD